MDEVEIPQYFLCPISLQIMKDPVTAVTGITYDRENIEHWLMTAKTTMCPVTHQPLPKDSDLTPNHTLQRLIKAWCITNAKNGFDLIPTPKPPLNKSYVRKLIREIDLPEHYIKSLGKIQELANENEKNRACLEEVGTVKAMIFLIIKCFKEGKISGVGEALKILQLIWTPNQENKNLLRENYDLIRSIIWVLGYEMDNHVVIKAHALIVLKMIIEVASSSLLERLNLEFFKQIVKLLREKISQQAIKAALQVLIEVCPWGTNRMKIVNSSAVFEVIELELGNVVDKKTTELIFCLLAHLSSCAEGRARILRHAGGIAMVSKRILRVSAGTDDRAVHILSLISRFSVTNEVLLEMLRVGAVAKLCMVLQANSEKYLKKKAREVLRLHSSVWNSSPCIAIYLLTKDPR